MKTHSNITSPSYRFRVQEQDHYEDFWRKCALWVLFFGLDHLQFGHGSRQLVSPLLKFWCTRHVLTLRGRYHRALMVQPVSDIIPQYIATPLAIALFVMGQTFVITSTWALGVTGMSKQVSLFRARSLDYDLIRRSFFDAGTFLGDYFGILMDHRVEGFPFNVLTDPMYDGSTMCFAATALWYGRPAGLFVTAFVYIVYGFALHFEG